MKRLQLSTLACALTAALALSACNKTGDGSTAPGATTGSTATTPPASAASR